MSDQFQKILDTNGNSHHARVVSAFRALDWQALVSPYYSDNFTNKAREIDVIAEKDHPAEDMVDRYAPIRTRLFLECKYIPQETVLWFDNKDMTRTSDLIDSMFGAETKRYTQERINYTYGEDVAVAKLFGSTSKNSENESLATAINQCLNALIYYRNETTAPVPGGMGLSTTLSYPVIVCNSFDNFRKASMLDSKIPLEEVTQPFQLEVNYAYLDEKKKPQNEFFLIDVITIDQIAQYTQELKKKDVLQAAQMVIRSSYSQSQQESENYDPYSSL